jgi:hypothetical protein
MDDEFIVEGYRQAGRAMALGLTVRPLRLPRSKITRMLLEREAHRDPRVRVALDAAIKAEQVKPRVLRRLVSGPIRIV